MALRIWLALFKKCPLVYTIVWKKINSPKQGMYLLPATQIMLL